MSLPEEQSYAQFEELCTLLRQNDSSVTRVEPPEDISGYGRQLGEALLENTVVTYLRLNVRKIVPNKETTLESAAPLLRYLQTSTALKEVKLESYSNSAFLQQLGHKIIQAITSNSSIVSLDALEGPFDILNVALEDEPILLQLAMHPSLQRLCLVGHNAFKRPSLMRVTAIASLLLSTKRLQDLDFRLYDFDRQSLLPILGALKENSTVTSLCFLFCSMNEEATEDFVEFVQHHCNTGTSNLSSLVLCGWAFREVFAGFSVGGMAATMLIGSSLQSLHLCGQQENRCMAAFFTALLQHKDQIRIASLTIDKLVASAANAMVEYLPNALSLRNLTVSQMDRNIDSSQVVAALRRNGSLFSVDMTKVSDVAGEPLQPYFSPDELRRIRAYGMRNQRVPMLLSSARSSNDTPTDDSSNNVHLYTRLFVATRPTDRTAPNNLVLGLLSGNEDVGW